MKSEAALEIQCSKLVGHRPPKKSRTWKVWFGVWGLAFGVSFFLWSPKDAAHPWFRVGYFITPLVSPLIADLEDLGTRRYRVSIGGHKYP